MEDKNKRAYYHKKWAWYYPLKPWIGRVVIKYSYPSCTSSCNGISRHWKVPTKLKVRWAVEVLFNPLQWGYKRKEYLQYKELVKMEKCDSNGLDNNANGKKIVSKGEKKPKEKELEKWYEENQELAEIDDYFRQSKQSWSDFNYQKKLKVYAIINNISFEDTIMQDPWDAIKSKLGRHNIWQTLYNRYPEGQWREATCKEKK